MEHHIIQRVINLTSIITFGDKMKTLIFTIALLLALPVQAATMRDTAGRVVVRYNQSTGAVTAPSGKTIARIDRNGNVRDTAGRKIAKIDR